VPSTGMMEFNMGDITKNNNKIFSEVLKNLAEVGVKRGFIRSYVLPDWWEESILSSPSGAELGLTYISSFFNIPVTRLLENQDLSTQGIVAVSYKKRADTSEDSLHKATLLGLWVARLVGTACKIPYSSIPKDAREVYAALSSKTKQGVGFIDLIDFAWMHGVPVVRISPPATGNHPDGLCTIVEGRPVIVLMKKHDSCAWQEFILAHELGHIACGHIFTAINKTMIDGVQSFASREKTEDEANKWGCTALSDNPLTDMNAVWQKRPSSGKDLSLKAFREAGRRNIDPGFLILNYARGVNDFRLGNSALMHVDDKNAFSFLDGALKKYIAEDDLSEENWARLAKLQS